MEQFVDILKANGVPWWAVAVIVFVAMMAPRALVSAVSLRTRRPGDPIPRSKVEAFLMERWRECEERAEEANSHLADARNLIGDLQVRIEKLENT